MNLDPLRVALPGQFGGVFSPIDIGNLSGGKTDHMVRGVVAIQAVEVVEVPAGGPHNQNILCFH